MRSLFDTALGYLTGLPRDFYGVDVADVRRMTEAALSDPTVLEGWQIQLDGAAETATAVDYEYAASLEH
jgi:hypothetical protein